MLLKRHRREVPELNATSMADISFMLLSFFLVTTSMDVDKGIVRQLPPADDSAHVRPTEVSRANLFEIEITSNDKYLVNGQESNLSAMGTSLTRFVAENGDKHVIAITTAKTSSYNAYFLLQNEITSVYKRVRNDLARKKYGKTYSRCSDEQREEVRRLCPLHISEPQKTVEEDAHDVP